MKSICSLMEQVWNFAGSPFIFILCLYMLFHINQNDFVNCYHFYIWKKNGIWNMLPRKQYFAKLWRFRSNLWWYCSTLCWQWYLSFINHVFKGSTNLLLDFKKIVNTISIFLCYWLQSKKSNDLNSNLVYLITLYKIK